MIKNCNCKGGNLDEFNDAIWLSTGGGHSIGYDWYIPYECLKCGESEDRYNRESIPKGVEVIECKTKYFGTYHYRAEYNIVINLIKEKYDLDKVLAHNVADIMREIIQFYNETYYEKFYQYPFKAVREAIIDLLLQKNYKTKKGFYVALKRRLESHYSTFDILAFITNWKSSDDKMKNQEEYGPCALGLKIYYDGKIQDSLNQIYFNKWKFEIEQSQIKKEILSLQSDLERILFAKICLQTSKQFGENWLRAKKSKTKSTLYQFLNEKKQIPDCDYVYAIGFLIVFEEFLKQHEITSKNISYDNYEKLKSELLQYQKLLQQFL